MGYLLLISCFRIGKSPCRNANSTRSSQIKCVHRKHTKCEKIFVPLEMCEFECVCLFFFLFQFHTVYIMDIANILDCIYTKCVISIYIICVHLYMYVWMHSYLGGPIIYLSISCVSCVSKNQKEHLQRQATKKRTHRTNEWKIYHIYNNACCVYTVQTDSLNVESSMLCVERESSRSSDAKNCIFLHWRCVIRCVRFVLWGL